jgi:hypothetical protein
MKLIVRLAAPMALLALVACGGGENRPPENLDNACALLDERPQYLDKLRRTEERWGIPPHVIMATIYQESKFVRNAKTPRRYALAIIPAGRISSAEGYSQALDGTWDDYREATGNRSARRTQFDDAVDFMGWYMSRAAAAHGMSPYDAARLYLAYHEGIAGYGRGSHNEKAWLLRVADAVGERSVMYQNQLIACGKL